MNYNKIYSECGVEICEASFALKGKLSESYVVFSLEKSGTSLFDETLEMLHSHLNSFVAEKSKSGVKPVMARYFVSDAANQSALVYASSILECPFSVIEQPPLQSSKVALWVWLSNESGNYSHLHTSALSSAEPGSYAQTKDIFDNYEKTLSLNKMEISSNCIRTWLFVHDVDVNYRGVVIGRKENFAENGLVRDTHYITSTGIEGRVGDPYRLVTMDAYSVGGLQAGQVCYLYAPANMNPTADYGVTFERGVYVQYGDRRHIFISGTASIDNKGEILYCGNILLQCQRMLENVEVLLLEAQAEFSDIAYLIVYVRDWADCNIVEHFFNEKLPQQPIVLTKASVCRPGWLIEMECMAVKEIKDVQYKNY